MHFPIRILLFTIISQAHPSTSANILFYIGVGSYSHRLAMLPLVESLADAGHNVTFLSPHLPKTKSLQAHSKIHEYNPPALTAWWQKLTLVDAGQIFEQRRNGTSSVDWFTFTDFGYMACEKLLEDDTVIDWIQKSKFDLVVVDVLLNECGFGLAYKFNAATILYSTSSLYPWLIEPFGLQAESSWVPDMILESQQDATFWQKIVSTLNPLMWQVIREWTYLPKLESLLRERIPGLSNMPALKEIERNTSLMLLNTHFSEEYARALPPFVISVGGASCFQNKSVGFIPKEMADFLEQGSDGFIYVSFGSYADVFDDLELREIFLETFRRLPKLRFIWKSKGDAPLDLPRNVFMTKWCPQQKLLGDSRIRAFITHGGLLSLHEAICEGVPLVAMPVFAEQDYNAERIHRSGYGIRLEITTVQVEQLVNAISSIATNQKYSTNIRTASKLFKDRPHSPIETATWWMEYVLRHRDDTTFLKPLGRHQTWFQRRLLDVWGVIFLVTSIVSFLTLYIVLKVVCFLLCIGSNTSTSGIIYESRYKKTL